jgi:hypothetical protein
LKKAWKRSDRVHSTGSWVHGLFIKQQPSNHGRWRVDGWLTATCWPTAVARPLLTAVRQWLTGTRRPRRSGAPNKRAPSLNRREGHNDSHLGSSLARKTTVKARDSGVTSSDLSDGGGSLQQSPHPKTWSNSFTTRFSSSS